MKISDGIPRPRKRERNDGGKKFYGLGVKGDRINCTRLGHDNFKDFVYIFPAHTHTHTYYRGTNTIKTKKEKNMCSRTSTMWNVGILYTMLAGEENNSIAIKN